MADAAAVSLPDCLPQVFAVDAFEPEIEGHAVHVGAGPGGIGAFLRILSLYSGLR